MLSRAAGLLLLIATAALTSAQGFVDQIKSKGELVIATDATYQPFESTVKGSSKIEGFDVDVGAELAREMGVKVRWINLEWAGVLGCLESGKADLVMAGVTITAERKSKGYLFSRPYYPSGQAIARRKGDLAIQGPQDLKDKMVAVQAETTGQFAVEKAGVPKSHMLKFDTVQDGLLDVVDKRADACVADIPVLKFYLSQGYPEIELAGPAIIKENLGIVAWKTHPELISVVNAELDHMMVDGRYAQFYEHWFQEPYTTAIVAELDNVKDQGSQVPALNAAKKAEAPQAAPTGTAFTFQWKLFGDSIPFLAKGAVLTLELTALSLVFGVAGGLALALLRISPIAALRPFAVTYIEIIRGTPLLMQIYVIYFVLPALHVNLPSFGAGVLALSLNAAAYCAEVLRAGIESIDSGQMEAARSLGMNYGLAMRWVILPQTVRRVLPPLTNEAVAFLKDSSLVSVVALAELMRVGKEIATDSGSPTTVYLSVAIFYLVMTLPLTWLVRRLEAKLTPGGRTA